MKLKHALYCTTTLGAALAMLAPLAVFGNPVDGVVAGGNATISQNGKTLTINQTSSKAIIDWRAFNINSDETTQFVQPSSSSIALNRIHDNKPSRIEGQLKANGNIILINPNGVVFSGSAKVDVNSLAVTSSDISNDDFMNQQKLVFNKPGNADAKILNQGQITAKDAGLVGFVAPQVENSGIITARLGKVHLASGDTFTLDMAGDGLTSIAVSGDMQKSLVANSGTIEANGGTIQLTAMAARGEVENLITNSGVLRADSVSEKNGTIIFSAPGGRIENSGVISATGKNAGQHGGQVKLTAKTVNNTGGIDVSGDSGGDVNITAGTITHSGTIKADGINGAAGTVTMNADTIHNLGIISASSIAGNGGRININFTKLYDDSIASHISVSSANAAGGAILTEGTTEEAMLTVSGNYSANGAIGGLIDLLAGGNINLAAVVIQANGTTNGGRIRIGGDYQGMGNTRRSKNTSIDDETEIDANGANGRVIIWADDVTRFDGKITASGANTFVETSAHTLEISGSVRASQWLLDPADLTISGADSNVTTSGTNPLTYSTNSGGATTVNVATIVSSLNAGTSVIIQTSASGTGGNGDITVSSAITSTGSGSLTLSAYRNITVNVDINTASNVVLNAAGSIVVNAAITASGLAATSTSGDITLGGNVSVSGNITLDSGNDLALNSNITKTTASASTFLLKAKNNITLAGGKSISSSTGAINLTLNSDSDASTSGAIVVGDGVTLSTISSYGGSITMGGGATPASVYAYGNTTYRDGILLNKATINAGGGNISLKAAAYASLDSSHYSNGVNIATSTLQTIGSGTVSVTGRAGASTYTRGLELGTGSTVSSVNGNITLNGLGQGTVSPYNYGNAIEGTISVTGSGSISLTGTNPTPNVALLFGNATVASTTGDITLSGTVTDLSVNGYVNGVGFYGTADIHSTSGNISLTANSGADKDIRIESSTNTIGNGSTTGNITINANTILETNPFSSIQTTGTVTYAPRSNNVAVGVGTGSGTLILSSAQLAKISAGTLVAGRSDNSGLLRFAGVNLSARNYNLSLLSGSGNIQFDGSTLTMAANKNFSTAATSGNFTVSAAGTITTSGTGNINIDDPVVLSNSLVFNTASGGALTLGSTASGAYNLTSNAGTTNLNGVINSSTVLGGTTTIVNVGASGKVQNGVDMVASGGTVNLANATYALSSEVLIGKSLTLNGNGAVLDGQSSTRAIEVAGTGGGVTVNLNSLTLKNGNGTGGSNQNTAGGALLVFAESNKYATVNISNSTLSNNTAAYYGAIYNDGQSSGHAILTLNNTTVTGNSGDYGAIGNDGQGSGSAALTITNSTISGNTGTSNVGGIFNQAYNSGSATVAMRDTILAGNTVSGTEIDYKNFNSLAAGVLTSNGYNLYGQSSVAGGFTGNGTTDILLTSNINTVLGSLASNGGPTKTMALLVGSAAYLKGGAVGSTTTDQRGVSRGSTISIGAYDYVPTSLVVNSTADTTKDVIGGATVTLRDALYYANLGVLATPTITFDPSTFASAQTVTLAQGQLVIGSSLTLQGPSAGVIIDANSLSRVMEIDGTASGITVGLDKLTFKNGTGVATNDSGFGGGLLVYSQSNKYATVNISNSTFLNNTSSSRGGAIFTDGTVSGHVTMSINKSTFTGNSSVTGGAIYNDGYSSGNAAMTITNSTINGNTANASGGQGGAILNDGYAGTASLTILNSTIVGNTAVDTGGIYSQGAAGGHSYITIGNTILSNNTNTSGGTETDIAHTSNFSYTSNGHNLYGQNGVSGGVSGSGTGDVMLSGSISTVLSALADNGGSTKTMALILGSPAIATGGAVGAVTTDQRGLVRTGNISIGAYEYNGAAPSITLTALAQNVTYGTAPSTATVLGTTYSFSCNDGCSSTVISGLILGISGVTTSSSGNYNAGTYATALNLSGATASNGYTISYVAGQLTVSQKSLTVTGVTGSDKVYNGSTADSLNTGSAALSGNVVGDNVILSSVSAAGSFANANVGNGKSITASGFNISGTDYLNYILTQPTGLTANISQAALTVKANNQSITYGSTLTNGYAVTSGTLYGSDAISGMSYTDDDSLSAGGFKNAGNYTITPLSATGTGVSNYNITYNTGSLAIARAALTVGGITAGNKTYDSTTSDTLSGTAALSGKMTGDNVILGGTGTSMFGDANVANGKAVTITGYSISGTDTNNYTFAQPTGLTANITQAALTIKANNQSINYGDTLTNGYSITSGALLGSDAITALSYMDSDSLSAGGFKNAGNYTITPSAASGTGGFNTTNYNITYSTGSLAIAKAALTVGGITAGNKTYDSTTSDTLSGTAALSGKLTGDNVILGGTGTGVFGNANAANGKAVTITGYSVSGTDTGNYTFTQPSGLTANITQAALTIKANNQSINYGDTLTNGYTITSGILLGSDAITALNYADDDNLSAGGYRNAGNYTITPSAASGTGGFNNTNYNITYNTGSLAIAKAALTVSGITAGNKTYDSTTSDTLSGTAALSGKLTGDNVILGGSGTAVFGDANVANGKAITISGYNVSGTDTGNYNFAQPSGLTANITQAALTIKANNKSINYGDTFTNGYTITSGALLGSDAISGLSYTDDDSLSAGGFKNAGNYLITPSSASGTGGFNTTNYNITYSTGSLAIAKAALTVGGITAGNKTYDSTTGDILSGTAALSGKFTGDNVILGGSGIAVFGDANVANGKSVTISAYNVTGTDTGNYTFAQPTGLTADITQAALTIKANNKSINYGDTLTNGYTITSGALLGSDAITALNYADDDNLSAGGYRNAGNYTITPSAATGTGGFNNINYNVTYTTGSLAIAKAALTVGGITAGNKTYDSNTSDTLSGTAILSGKLTGDNLILGGSGTAVFGTASAADGKAVTVSGYSVSGTDTGNYTFSQPTGLTANISKALITIKADDKSITYGDTFSNSYTITSGALLGSDSISGVTINDDATTSTSLNKNAGTWVLTASSAAGSGVGNYDITYVVGSLVIGQKGLTVSGVIADNKTYDSTTAATIHTGSASLSNLITNDLVTLGGTVTGVFTNANVGNGKTVNTSGATISGHDAGNYSLTQASTTADINQASLTVKANSQSITYGGTFTNGYAITSGALLGSDAISGMSYVDDDSLSAGGFKNAGNYTITPSAATGSGLSNYNITYHTNSLTIAQKALTVSGIIAGNKTYDSTTNDTLSGTAALSGKLTGDNVTLSGTGTSVFGNANVANGKAVTISGYSVSGSDTGNYTFAQPTGLTANITQASITLKANDQSITYGNTLTNGYTITSGALLGSDAISSLSYADDDSLSGGGYKNAGTYTITPSAATGTGGFNNINYNISYNTGSLAIAQKALTVGGIAAGNKTYDSTTSDILSGTAALSGKMTGDNVILGGTGISIFGDANVANGKAVTISGYNISGTDTGNYTFAQPAGLTANITQAAITIKAADKSINYGDALTNGYSIISGALLGSDAITALTYIDDDSLSAGGYRNAGNYTITPSAASGTGGFNNVNYNISYNTGSLAIARKALTISGIAAGNKTYDTTTTATLGGTAGLSGKLTGDDVILGGSGTGVFSNANIGTSKAVTISGYSISGADTNNYNFAQPSGLSANISAAAITIKAADKSISYGDLLTNSYSITAGALLGSDSITSLNYTDDAINSPSGNRNVGSYTITASNAAGSGIGNYHITYDTGALNIAQKVITVTGITATVKDYTGTTGAVLNTSSRALNTILSGDNVMLNSSGYTANFNSANAGSSIGVSVSGLSLSGAQSGNYNLTQPSGITGTINRATLTVTANNVSKNYGSIKNFIGSEFTSGALQHGETLSGVTLASTGAGAAANVAGYNIVASNATGANGFNANNYNINYVDGILTVNPADLTITVANKSMNYGATNPVFTYNVTGLLNSDAVSGVTLLTDATSSGSGHYNAGTWAINGSAATGTGLTNYNIHYTAGIFNIAQAILNITADNQSKIYGDANPALTYSSMGLVSGDSITGALSSTGINVGTSSITQGTLSADSNYAITYNSGNLNITAAPITVTADSYTRNYNSVNPGFNYSVSGMKNSESAYSVFNSPSLSTMASQSSAPGNYAINMSGGTLNPNYYISSYINGILHINPAVIATPAPAVINDVSVSQIQSALAPIATYSTSILQNNNLSGNMPLTNSKSFGDFSFGGSSVFDYSTILAAKSNQNISLDYTILEPFNKTQRIYTHKLQQSDINNSDWNDQYQIIISDDELDYNKLKPPAVTFLIKRNKLL